MSHSKRLVLGALLLSTACGGGGSNNGPDNTIWAGTLTVSSNGTAGSACATTHTITFTAAGASLHVLTIPGGDCLEFVNADTMPHQPGPIGTNLCNELNAPASIPPAGTFTTTPFVTAGTCQWQDDLNPLPSGGGGGY